MFTQIKLTVTTLMWDLKQLSSRVITGSRSAASIAFKLGMEVRLALLYARDNLGDTCPWDPGGGGSVSAQYAICPHFLSVVLSR